MKGSGAGWFAVCSVAVALAAGLVMMPLVLPQGESAVRWALCGWLIMAVTGVGGGVWLTKKHGQVGAGFSIALGTCMLARLLAAIAGAIAAAVSGIEAAWAYLAGLATGYLPLQLFEVGWFMLRARRAGLPPDGRAAHSGR